MSTNSMILHILTKLGWKLGKKCLLHVNAHGKFGKCEAMVPPDCNVFNNIWFGLFLTMLFASFGFLFGFVRRGRALRRYDVDTKSFSKPPVVALQHKEPSGTVDASTKNAPSNTEVSKELPTNA